MCADVTTPQVSAGPLDQGERLRHLLLLAITPWLQLAINPNLFLTPGGNIYLDPWLYTGYFLSLPRLAQQFPGTYYGSRLSWLLPGYAANQVLPPFAAAYALHIGFFYVLLGSTYALVTSGVNRRTAFLVTQVVAWSSIVLAAVSWDYVDGAGIVFTMVTLLCLERAARQAPFGRAWAFAGGAAAVCMVSSNIVLVAFWALCLLFFLLRLSSRRWRDISVCVLMMAAGAAAGYLAFGYANTRLAGGWSYLAPQLREARSLAAAPNPWRVPISAWLGRAGWLVLIVLASLGAMTGLVARRRLTPFARVMQGLLLLAVALWVGVHVSGTPVMQISYYSSYLAPFALIALPLHAELPEVDSDTPRFALVEFGTIALFAYGYLLSGADVGLFWWPVQPWFEALFPIVRATGQHPFWSFPAVAALTVALVGMGLAEFGRPGWPRWFLFVAALVFASSGAPPDLPARSTSITKAYYAETVAAHRFISEYVIPERKIRIWCNAIRTQRPVIGISSTFLWGFALVNYEMPKLTDADARRVDATTRLVFLAASMNEFDAARGVLANRGWDTDIVARQEFGGGDEALTIVVTDLRPALH